MAGNGINLNYWDTCIFYALLKGEDKHGDGILEGITDDYDSFERGRLKIITSTITIAEVSLGHFENPDDLTRFKALRFANGFEFSSPVIPIMELASELKDYYYNNPLGQNGQYKLLNIADAIHLATAIRREADTFVTLDKKHKKDGEIGLLKLANAEKGVLAGKYHLDIRKPTPPPQKGLF